MPITYCEDRKLFTLQTQKSTYQMKIDACGYLRHLYYGRKCVGDDFSYLYRDCDRGFSGNPYACGRERLISLDTMPLEYSSSDVGDYRVNSLSVVHPDGSRGTDLKFQGFEIQKRRKYALTGLPTAYSESEADADTLVITLGDTETRLEVRLYYGVFYERDVITRAVEIRNGGDSAVYLEKAASWCVDFPYGSWDLLHFHGRHCMERMPEREPLRNCIQTISSGRGTSSHQHNPFVILCDSEATEDTGDCYGFMLAYSGSHKTEVELDQFGLVRVVSGISDEQFRWKLEPESSFYTPEAILSFTSEGLGQLSRNYHVFIRHHICRGTYKSSRRPVLFNNWEATYADFDEERLLSLAAQAADLGVELFVLDDGWFHLRTSDTAGLGDWFPNRDKLPHGLAALADRICGLGMKFGLWVEPECVNEDSDLFRAHPDWALTVPGRLPVLGRMQLMLDLSRQEVQDYLYDAMEKLLTEAKISYIKWDMNRSLSDLYSHALPADRQGEVGHRYVLGLYSLLERLTGAFPEVLFEGCSGGGGRFDAGMLYYTPQIWCSDDTDAIQRLEIQRGTSFGYPASTMGCHVTASPNHQTGRSTPLNTRGIVAMSGMFGYEMNLATLSEAERQEVREQIRTYQKDEPLIREGNLYRLGSSVENGHYTAWQYVSPDQKTALVNVVVTDPKANGKLIHLRLKGLKENVQYRLEDTKAHTISGAALMYGGYTLPLLSGDYPAFQLRLAVMD